MCLGGAIPPEETGRLNKENAVVPSVFLLVAVSSKQVLSVALFVLLDHGWSWGRLNLIAASEREKRI